MRMMEPDISRARAWSHVPAGDLPAARAGLWAAADEAAASGQITQEGSALHDLARLGEPSIDAIHRRLAGVAARCDGPFPVARLAYVAAVAAGDAGALAAASERFEAMGGVLYAAETAADAPAASRHAGRS